MLQHGRHGSGASVGMSALRHCVAVAVGALALSTSSCTLVKPVAGAIVGPVVVMGRTGPLGGCGCSDGRAILIFYGAFAAAGAVVGLVTGVISDVQALTGDACDPCRNWYDPFATNTSR
jgi:hypothetical protein